MVLGIELSCMDSLRLEFERHQGTARSLEKGSAWAGGGPEVARSRRAQVVEHHLDLRLHALLALPLLLSDRLEVEEEWCWERSGLCLL